MNIRHYVFSLMVGLQICSTLLSAAVVIGEDSPLKVVTTLTSYASLVEAVGGERVAVSSIAPAQFNPHFIEPKPSDVLRLKRADLFVHSGLDLEAWRGPLVVASARGDIGDGGARSLDLSRGIRLLNVPSGQVSRSEGDIHMFGNPHYWTSPESAKVIAKSIGEKLCEIDEAHCGEYNARRYQFLGNLDEKIKKWRGSVQPFAGQEVIAYHDEWIYLLDFLGLHAEYFIEPKPGIPPSPRHLEDIRERIKKNGVKALVQATFYPHEAGESLRQDTGIKVLLLCQNVGELPECSSYIEMIDYNVRQIVEALGK